MKIKKIFLFILIIIISQGPGICQEMDGITFTEYSLGKKKIEIKAEKVIIRSKKIGFFKTPLIKEAYMIKPEIFSFENNKEISQITADTATMNMGNKKFLLRDNIILIADNGKKLYAEEMAIDPKNMRLSIRGKFLITENGTILKGEGLKSDLALKKFILKTELKN